MWLEGIVECSPMFDAEHLPETVPAGFAAVLIYAGGTAAANPWPDADIDRVSHLHQLPAWVPDPAADDPVTAAQGFIQWLLSHGFTPLVGQSGWHQRVVWDMETAGHADAHWLHKAADVTAEAGYWNWPYGSASTLFGLPPRDGYYVADWTNVAHMYQRPEVMVTQYQANVPESGGQIDLDAIVKAELPGLRRPAAA